MKPLAPGRPEAPLWCSPSRCFVKLTPRFLEFAWRLELALRVMRTFDPHHPRVEGPLEDAFKAFRDLVSGRVEIQLAVSEGRLFVNDEWIEAPGNPNVANLMRQMADRDLRALILGRALDHEAFRTFVALLATPCPRLAASGGAAGFLKLHPARHLQLAEVRYQAVTAANAQDGAPATAPATGAPVPHAALPAPASAAPRVDPRHADAIRARLEQMGLPPERLEAYLAAAAWDSLDEAGRVKVASEGETAFNLPPGQVLDLIRDLADASRVAWANQVLLHHGSGLFAAQVRRRQATSELFVEIARLAKIPGLPEEVERCLYQLLRDHFAQERDPKLQPLACEALEVLLGTWLQQGRMRELHHGLDHLGGSALIWVPGAHPWKKESLEGIYRGLAAPAALLPFVNRALEANREALARDVHPLLSRMGEPAAAYLLQRLDQEPSQARRKRLMELIRVVGREGVPPLRKALGSPHWHLVRNVINCLRDLGAHAAAPDIALRLRHDDARVRAAAARALRDMGAQDLLLTALGGVDVRTRSEVLLALGHLKTTAALPRMVEAAKSQVPLPQRLDALRAVGLLDSPEAVAALLPFLEPGGVFEARDAPELRREALRVLCTMTVPEAKWATQAALDGATGQAKDEIQRILLGE